MKKVLSKKPLLLHGYFYRDGRQVTFPEPKNGRAKLLRAEAYNDFTLGQDQVIRFNDCCWIIDGNGAYAPIQVKSDVLTEEGKENLRALPPAALTVMIDAIQRYAFLSDEGRQERLAFIATLPKFQVFAQFGGKSLKCTLTP